MAFYTDEEEEINPEEQGAQTMGGGGSTVLGAGGGEPGAGAAADKSGAGSTKAENFVGITQYLDANKPQSEKLAGQVAGNIDQKAMAADQKLGEATNSFNQAAEAQKVQADEGLLGQVKQDATQIAKDQEKLGSFAKMRDAQYAGPQRVEDVEPWGQLQSALKTAQDSKAMAGTEEGRMGLIKEISNNPRQSQGALTFDNLLLQSNPNASQKLQQAGSNLNDIDQRIAGAQAGATTKAQEIAAANEATRNAARGAIGEGWQGLTQSLTEREAAEDAKAKADFESMLAGVSQGQLTPEQIQAMGLNPDSRTYGTNLSDFLSYADNIDKYSVAGQDDLARHEALKQLSGDVSLGDDILSSVGEFGKRGSNLSFDTNKFNQAAEAQKAEFKKLYEVDPKAQAKALGDWGNGSNVKDKYYTPFKDLKSTIEQTGDLPPDAAAAYRSIMTPAEYKTFLSKVQNWKPGKRQYAHAGSAISASLPKRMLDAKKKDYDDGGSYLKNAASYGTKVSDATRKAQQDYFGLNDTVLQRLKGV